MSGIHPSSYIGPKASVGEGVEIGPFCVVESGASIGTGCVLESHVVVRASTRIGERNYLAEGTVLGGPAQHKQGGGLKSGRLDVGDDNTFREHVTVHCGLSEEGVTTIGDDNLLMVNSHVAHDCFLANQTILANNVMLAGHVHVADSAFLSGAVGIHQFCRVGTFAMVGGQAHITKDVPPYVTVDGVSSLIVGLNVVGLRRGGFDRSQIQELKDGYRLAFRSGLRWDDAISALRERFPEGHCSLLADFMAGTKRGCVQERRMPKPATIRLHVPDAKGKQAEESEKKASA